MTVRAAKFVDVPRIVALISQAHERSIYADTATFDEIEAKRLVMHSLQRHDHQNNGGTLVLVSETDGEVRGFLIAMLDNVYPCLKELMVTDLFFILGLDADPRDARRMIRRLEAWAEANPKVIELHLGVTDGITDWRRTAKFYEHLGLERCGAMLRRRFER